MIEKYIRQYCKKNKFTRVKYIQLMDNLHIISIFIKLVVIVILSFYFVNSSIEAIDSTFYTYNLGQNSVASIDTKHLRDSMVFIDIIITTFILMSLMDIADLLLWWERTNRDLIISVIGNAAIFTYITMLNTDISVVSAFGVSILEPSIYVLIFLVIYKKFQLKKGICNKIKGSK